MGFPIAGQLYIPTTADFTSIPCDKSSKSMRASWIPGRSDSYPLVFSHMVRWKILHLSGILPLRIFTCDEASCLLCISIPASCRRVSIEALRCSQQAATKALVGRGQPLQICGCNFGTCPNLNVHHSRLHKFSSLVDAWPFLGWLKVEN